ncbi:Ionotropic receptor 764 [Blattella germanica]|nr:Ionotropic receptor 764 [Blattella germanica]
MTLLNLLLHYLSFESTQNIMTSCIVKTSQEFFSNGQTLLFVPYTLGQCKGSTHTSQVWNYSDHQATFIIGDDSSCIVRQYIRMVDYAKLNLKDQAEFIEEYYYAYTEGVKTYCVANRLDYVEEEILKMFHGRNTWPMGVFPFDTTFLWASEDEIFGCILLFHFSGDYKELENDVFSLLLVLNNHWLLKQSGYYLLALFGTVDHSRASKAILQNFGSVILRLHQVVLLIADDNSSTVSIYNFNPYDPPSGRCGWFINEKKIGECTPSENALKLFGNESFYKKIFPKLEGCYITVSAMPEEPLIIGDTSPEPNTSMLSNQSVAFVVARMIFEQLNVAGLTLNYPQEFSLEGYSLTMNEGFLTFNYATSVWYHALTYYWFVPMAETYPRWSTLTRVFTAPVWVSGILALFLSALVFKLLSDQYKQSLGLFRSLMHSLAVNVGVSVAMSGPLQHSIFLSSWLIYSMAINTVFQTFFTSYLVDPGHQHQIDSFEELILGEYDLYFSSRDVLHSFVGNNVTPHMKIVTTEDAALLGALNTSKGAAFISEEAMVYFLNKICDGRLGKRLHRVKDHSLQHHAFITLSDTTMMQPFMKIMGRLVASGIPTKLVNDILYPRGAPRSLEFDDFTGEYFSFSLKHQQSTFFLYFIGVGLGLVFFLIEVFFF